MERTVDTLFARCGDEEQTIVERVGELAALHGEAVYAEALRQLVGKEFTPDCARLHWEGILTCRARLFPGETPRGSLLASALLHLQQAGDSLCAPRIVEAADLQQMRREAATDGLTGLYHQSYFKAHLHRLLDRSRGRVRPLAVVLLDLDHFKQYNDTAGHLAGDQLLARVGEIITANMGRDDVGCRYGGDEFALLLPGASAHQAHTVADRIRTLIAELGLCSPGEGGPLYLTVSGGVAAAPENGATPETLLGKADRELYLTKRQRNAIFPTLLDARSQRRFHLTSVVDVAPLGQKRFRPCLSFDISSSGSILGTDSPFPAGETLKLRFRTPFWPSNRLLTAIVRHSRTELRNGLVLIGVEFEDPEEQVLPLLSPRLTVKEGSHLPPPLSSPHPFHGWALPFAKPAGV